VETWTREARSEGVFVTVPAEAQQALMFLAPETGGDFNTLRKAVHDRPGVLCPRRPGSAGGQLGPDAGGSLSGQVKVTSQTDLKALKEHAEMAARSLGSRSQDCFDKPIDQQAPAWRRTPKDWCWTTPTRNRWCRN
jgi:hypothetical protein